MKSLLLIFSVLFLGLFPHPIRGDAPLTNEHVPLFTGLVLLGNKDTLNPQGYESVREGISSQIALPGNIFKLKKRLQPFYNTPLDRNTLTAIKTQIIKFYQNHHRPIVIVTIPKQDISHGVLQVVVTQGTLGKVTVKGNKWFSTKNIQRGIRIHPGDVIASDLLNQDLYWMNQNPFRTIDAIYAPGDEEGTTDIELEIVDRFPLRLYMGIDNSGNDVTGNNRLLAGVNWGEVFGSDQRLSYQVSTSSDFKRFYAHTLFYEVPLPWRHLLSLYGGYSHIDADFLVPNINNTRFYTHGFSIQASLRYTIPLSPFTSFLHEVTSGFDFKRTNNTLDFGQRPVISEDNVNLTQLMLGYQLGYALSTLNLSFEVEGFWSPGEWISDQTNPDYQSLRPFAKNQYVYTRSATTLTWHYYKKWSMYHAFRAQWASINLPPSESYGTGGYNTVRGYKERIVNGDNAFIWNFEMRTPSVSVLHFLTRQKKLHDELYGLLFFDYGCAGVKQAVSGQNKTTYLASFGPAIRYQIAPYLTLRVDWGFQLHSSHLDSPHHRLHFALIAGY